MNTQIRRIHKFKFYLNASHYVFFNGRRGKPHPHTWEFMVKILDLRENTVEFNVYENALVKVFAPYQNQTLNDLPPFHALMPTLENMTEYFGAELRKTVAGLQGRLLEVEGSETPTRGYLIDYSLAAEPITLPAASDSAEAADRLFDMLLEDRHEP